MTASYWAADEPGGADALGIDKGQRKPAERAPHSGAARRVETSPSGRIQSRRKAPASLLTCWPLFGFHSRPCSWHKVWPSKGVELHQAAKNAHRAIVNTRASFSVWICDPDAKQCAQTVETPAINRPTVAQLSAGRKVKRLFKKKRQQLGSKSSREMSDCMKERDRRGGRSLIDLRSLFVFRHSGGGSRRRRDRKSRLLSVSPFSLLISSFRLLSPVNIVVLFFYVFRLVWRAGGARAERASRVGLFVLAGERALAFHFI